MTADRALVALFSLALVAAASVLALMALGWTAPMDWLQIFFHNSDIRIGAGVFAVFAALLGLKLLGNSLYRPKGVEGTVVHEGAGGKVHITVSAMESLIHKAARHVAGVKEITPRIKVMPEGVAVLARVSVTPDLSIPAVSQELQTRIKDYLQEIAGTQVLEVKVLVESVAVDARARVE